VLNYRYLQLLEGTIRVVTRVLVESTVGDLNAGEELKPTK
jgi:hypothetical protein